MSDRPYADVSQQEIDYITHSLCPLFPQANERLMYVRGGRVPPEETLAHSGADRDREDEAELERPAAWSVSGHATHECRVGAHDDEHEREAEECLRGVHERAGDVSRGHEWRRREAGAGGGCGRCAPRDRGKRRERRRAVHSQRTLLALALCHGQAIHAVGMRHARPASSSAGAPM
jgi:hypothetical protein